jgi:hypothetical protein
MHVTRLFCPPLKWEKGGGGMRGNSARECKTSLISPKNSTPESNPSLSQTRQPPRAAADGAASTKVDARRNAPTARFPIASPFPGGTPARRDVNRQPRSRRGSVHEGGRPAERPRGAISNRQPLPRRNACTARFPIASPFPGGTPARRDFQSPAPSLAERPRGAMSIASPAADGATSTKVDARRNACTARCQSPAPPPAERPRGAMSIASPAADGAASTKADARRNARTARCQSPAPSLTGVDFSASPCMPSPVSSIRMLRLPLLPVWEKGAGGMRGNSARECRRSPISPKKSTLESRNEGKVRGAARLRPRGAQSYPHRFLRIFHKQRYICDGGRE